MARKIKINADGGVEIHHYDIGGMVGLGAVTGGIGNVAGGAVGGLTGSLASNLTTTNGYQAGTPDISAQENNYNTANAGQNSLASALTNQANGQGPNPAQIQYQQNANKIAQGQAQTYAANRALNPALAARMAGNNAVSTGQNAASGEAELQAQQQIAAQQQLNQLYGTQENAATGNANAVTQNAMGAEGINAQIAQNNANAINNTEGGILNGIGSAVGSFLAKGGEVGKDGTMFKENKKTEQVPSKDRFPMPSHMKAMADIYHPQKFASGGMFQTKPGVINTSYAPSMSNAQDLYSPSFTGGGGGGGGALPTADPRLASLDPSGAMSGGSTMAGGTEAADLAPVAMLASKGGKVPAMVSPGELYVPPSKTKAVAAGMEKATQAGEKIPGKAKVKGDSEKNDTVPKNLEEGGVVVPRSVMESDDPEKEAAKFIADHIRKSKGDKKDHGDFKEALKRAVSERKNK